jgi:hypothetical protein
MLKLAGIDFPTPLLDALQNDRLVIFAGAGVSVEPPASLPSFIGLVRAIAEACNIPVNEDAPEITLGELTSNALIGDQKNLAA